MTKTLGVGIIGCGNISTTYFGFSPLFRGIEVRAGADLNMKLAKQRADEYGVRAMTVDTLLKADDIDIVVNLTIPAAHYDVSAAALDAGKHVYSEKPFVLSVKEGNDLRARATKRKVRIGSAPDTFLGGASQLARQLVDTGRLGKIASGTLHIMSHGMEHWHPNPDFFFQPGGGPVLDLGPYYIAGLINLIGPVKRVAALTSIPAKERTITSRPRHGEKIPVTTPTTIFSLMEFENGASVSLHASWDVWAHNHAPIELYCEEGSLYLPDPNFFGGPVTFTNREKLQKKVPTWDHPFGVPNQKHPHGMVANYRTAGLADMALAIGEGRQHRCSMEAALHAIDVMTGMLKSGETGKFVEMTTTCERPPALGVKEAKALLKPARRQKI
jgi:predicted dehydrogenase